MSVERIIAAHLQVFNAPAGPARRKAIAQLYTEDVVAGKPDVRLTGHAGVDQAVAGMQAQLPGMRITRNGPLQAVHELVIFSWTTGPEGGPAVVSGREVLIIRDGTKVSSFYVLVDAWHSD